MRSALQNGHSHLQSDEVHLDCSLYWHTQITTAKRSCKEVCAESVVIFLRFISFLRTVHYTLVGGIRSHRFSIISHTMKPSQSLPSKCSLWQKPTMAYLSHPPASQIRIFTLHRTSQRIRPSTRPNDPTSPNLELSASSDFWPQPHPLSHH